MTNRNIGYFSIVLLLLLPSSITVAAPIEAWYQKVWCNGMGGQLEYRLDSGRRIDCLTNSHAIEIEFARKWPEAIGQALDYSMLTGKHAGIVLILNKGVDFTHWERMRKVIDHYQLPIQVWRLGP
ncbi:hypothetical protein [Endozoicomonas ascidiicola]|uniref:hypothetical protein n=1 Tax=Endozoicomonas ascidiicola TaxID=1698521 RepID=UPI000A49CF90|nr:hypothetical protein [Endozoicomonas ascidiicola]